MTVTRTTVSGSVMLPDGSTAPDGTEIIFSLRAWDRADGALVMHGPIVTYVTGGVISVQLFRTSDGDRPTVYDVAYNYACEFQAKRVAASLGSITLTGDAANFADLLTFSSAATVTPTEKEQAVAAAAQAAAYAAAAGASAASITLTTSRLDTTTGRVLKVGDAGILGRAVQLTSDADIMTAPVPGAWCTFGIGNTGTPVAGSAGWVRTVQWNTDARYMEAVLFYPSASRGRKFQRFYDTTTSAWLDWVETTPVSGSNANGTYVRFSNGTQICYGEISTGTGLATGAVTWTFPAVFNTSSPITLIEAHATVPRVTTTQARSATSVGVNLWDLTGARVDSGLHLMAIGPWK